MSSIVSGGLVGGLLGGGVWWTIATAVRTRRPSLEERVLPYLRDLPVRRPVRASATSPVGAVLGWTSGWVDRVLGGASSIRSRLDRAGQPMTVHEFRVEQATWGLVAFGVCAVPSGLVALRHPDRGPVLFIACGAALCVGVLLRENRLTSQVRKRESLVLAELPVVAELLALAVAAGEGPLAALDRVVRHAGGEFAGDLEDLVAQTRTGMPLVDALDRLGSRSGVTAVTRFAHGLSTAVERGTPLAEVLHAQAGDVREAARRALIESGARREVLMMVPVVFLVLPTVVVFAFWPGFVGLQLVVP